MGYYKKYLQSNIIKNQDVKDTTYYTYERHMTNFLMWLGEFYGDIDLYSEEFMEDAVDICKIKVTKNEYETAWETIRAFIKEAVE